MHRPILISYTYLIVLALVTFCIQSLKVSDENILVVLPAMQLYRQHI